MPRSTTSTSTEDSQRANDAASASSSSSSSPAAAVAQDEPFKRPSSSQPNSRRTQGYKAQDERRTGDARIVLPSSDRGARTLLGKEGDEEKSASITVGGISSGLLSFKGQRDEAAAVSSSDSGRRTWHEFFWSKDESRDGSSPGSPASRSSSTSPFNPSSPGSSPISLGKLTKVPTTMAERLSAGKEANIAADNLRYRIENNLQEERPMQSYTSPGSGMSGARSGGAAQGMGSSASGLSNAGIAGLDGDWSSLSDRIRSALSSGAQVAGDDDDSRYGQLVLGSSSDRAGIGAYIPASRGRATPKGASGGSGRASGSSVVVGDPSIGIPPYHRPMPNPTDDALALLLPLLILLSTLVFLLLLFIILVILVRRRARIALSEGDGPLDVGREEELEGLGGLEGVEERWLETQDEATRRGYARARDWCVAYPPGSLSTDITLSQFLTIQEKGVSAWSFDPDYESNPSVFVEARTEITFIADGQGMASQEGGGCCVQSNLPLPKLNEVYYWECKMFTKPETTNIALGLATKPYPSFRLPGFSKFSVGYFSADGFKCHNYPFAAQSYGPAYVQGDVIGIGYRPRSGTVFFTRNGKKLEDAFVGLQRYNLFPTVGADGPAEVHVNLGQAGFVFIEANVKKWGLAPMVGTLAPPPAYGMERGSILIETGQGTSGNRRDVTPPPPPTPPSAGGGSSPNGRRVGSSPNSSLSRRAPRSRRARTTRASSLTVPGGASSSAQRLTIVDEPEGLTDEGDTDDGSNSAPSPRRVSDSSDAPHNPPTPNALDISLHALPPHQLPSGGAPAESSRGGILASYFPPQTPVRGSSSTGANGRRSPSPPPYPGPGNYSADPEAGFGSVRRASGRTHELANRFFGFLADRGLLTPLATNQTPPPGSDPSFFAHGPNASSAAAPQAQPNLLRTPTSNSVGQYENSSSSASSSSSMTESERQLRRNTDANRRVAVSNTSGSVTPSARSSVVQPSPQQPQQSQQSAGWFSGWFR